MATIGYYGKGGNLKRILFQAGNGKRKTLWLGDVTKSQAIAYQVKVQQIIQGNITGVLPDEAARWIAKLDDTIYEKFVGVGLLQPRPKSAATLGEFLKSLFDTLTIKKPNTLQNYKSARLSLEEFFTHSRLLTSITPMDADKYRAWMVEVKKHSQATVSKRIGTARQFFKIAVKWKALSENPFADVKAGTQLNRLKMYFVSREEIEVVMSKSPDAEWRLIIALSRYGGLRCPSEHLALRWDGIDWDRNLMKVHSPKTEHIPGKEFRMVPIFPELLPYLQEARRQAKPEAVYVIARYRQRNANLRTQFERIIARAGLEPWPRLFHNMRSSRQTELGDTFPQTTVCQWLGNSERVAGQNYNQVTESHVQKAIETLTGEAPKAAQKTAQHPSADAGIDEQKTPLAGSKSGFCVVGGEEKRSRQESNL